MPTLPSEVEQLANNAGEIARQVSRALDSLDGVLTEIVDATTDNRDRFESIVASIDEFAKAIVEARPAFDELVDEATGTSTATRRSLGRLDGVLAENAAELPELFAELQRGSSHAGG